jgi:spermidine/putrescine transport system ATP-binding protein/putrescine transport system ATP-binding protein
MQIELRQLQKQVGITFVFVTHDQEEALSMSDRIAVMHKGKVAQIAGPKDLYESPNSVLVASFIGNINLIDATVKSVSGGVATLDAPGFGTVTAPANGVAAGAKAIIAVRPEKLEVYSARPANGPVVQAKMGPAAYLGDRSHYHVMVSGRSAPISVAAQNYSRTEERFEAGQTVYLTWTPESLLVYPA